MTRLVTATLIALATTALAPADAQQTAACSGWTIVPSPNPAVQNDNSLTGISGRFGWDIWAVGQYVPDSSGTILQTLVEHFDGRKWSIVTSPNVGTQANALASVAATADGQAFAVGYHIDDESFLSRSLIESWNGHAWSVAEHPDPGVSAQLFGVAALSANDVWAVGSAQPEPGHLVTLIEHYDGHQWSVVPSPNPGATGNVLYGVAAHSANDVWAVGQQVGSQAPNRALVLHWDGATWSPAPVADAPETDKLISVDLYGVAATATAVATVGDAADNRTALQAATFAESESGFVGVPVETPGKLDHRLFGVAINSTGTGWAVGEQLGSDGNLTTLIVSHDGSAWKPVASPNAPSQGDNELATVTFVGDGDAWAVGNYDGPNALQTLILHHCK